MVALQRRIFKQSQIGAFVVNRENFKDYDFVDEADEFNRVLGIDFNLNSADNNWIGKFYTHKSFQANATIRKEIYPPEPPFFTIAVFGGSVRTGSM